MMTSPFAYVPPGLCSMASAPPGEEQGVGGGGVQRVTVGDDGKKDAEANAGATSTDAQPGDEAPAGKVEGLPEGYDSVEAFVAAVNDGTYKAPDSTEEKPATVTPEALPGADDPRLEPYTKEFTEKGDLSPESIAKATKDFNVPEVLVRAYVDLLKGQSAAKVTVDSAPFHQAAGSQEEWGKFQEWTTQEGNLPANTEKAYTTLMAQGKTAEALAVLQPVLSAWKASGGGAVARDVTQEGGGGGQGGGAQGEVYTDWSQVQADMDNPKYRDDASFRKDVEAKLARSPSL